MRVRDPRPQRPSRRPRGGSPESARRRAGAPRRGEVKGRKRDWRNPASATPKPPKGMMPARARERKSIAFEVTGIGFERPPISRMSFVWTAWMTLPAPRKRRALKNAWLKRWYKAALYPAESREGSVAIRYAPAPRPRNMYASWEIVENARTLLMSKFTTAIVAAKIVVKPPIAAMTRIAVNGGVTSGERGTRKMNARAVR